MGVYVRKGSPYFWVLLERHGRKRESTGIRCDAISPKVRQANREQAEAFYHARMVQLARQKVGLPIDSAITLNKYADWYETHHIAQHKSQPREVFILAVLRRHFGSMRLADIKPARWKEYETQRLKDGVSLNTIGRELSLMKTMLKTAVGEHLEVSPLAHVKRKSTKVPPKRTITATEEARLLDELKPGKYRGGTFGDAELSDMYLVAVGTLLRQMNVIELTRKQFDGTRVLADTKSGQHQVSVTGPTMLQTRAARVLKKRLPKTANGLFFPKWAERFAKDRNGANSMFLRVFRRACKRAGIPWGLNAHGVVWHTATRASGATRMMRDYGIDVRTVQLIGGWHSLDQMAQYLGISLTFGGVHSELTKTSLMKKRA